MFYGKLIAGALGFLVAGVFGLIVGLFVGHFFDRGLGQVFAQFSPENIARIKANFFETTFLLLGYLAKVDGRISQEEVDHTEMIIAQMQLNHEQRRDAIELFRRGSKAEFNLDSTLTAFLDACDRHHQLQQTLMLFLVSLALADNRVDEPEREALRTIGGRLGFSVAQVDQFVQMAQAQARFHREGGGAAASSGQTLADAYAALGVSADVSDAVLKKAYRKLMSENHPDKLIAKGVPEDMVKVATEKSQDISGAYDMIRKHRAGE
jgi:DnaJ like chaperone protein